MYIYTHRSGCTCICHCLIFVLYFSHICMGNDFLEIRPQIRQPNDEREQPWLRIVCATSKGGCICPLFANRFAKSSAMFIVNCLTIINKLFPNYFLQIQTMTTDHCQSSVLNIANHQYHCGPILIIGVDHHKHLLAMSIYHEKPFVLTAKSSGRCVVNHLYQALLFINF